MYEGWPGTAERDGYAGLYEAWLRGYDETATDLSGWEPRITRAITAVLAVLALVAEDQTDPAWSVETAALVDAFRVERARVRREIEWAFRPRT